MKTYMPLDGFRWSCDSDSALCDIPQTNVLGQAGGVHTVFTIAVSIIGSIAIAAILDRCHLSYIFARKRFLR